MIGLFFVIFAAMCFLIPPINPAAGLFFLIVGILVSGSNRTR